MFQLSCRFRRTKQKNKRKKRKTRRRPWSNDRGNKKQGWTYLVHSRRRFHLIQQYQIFKLQVKLSRQQPSWSLTLDLPEWRKIAENWTWSGVKISPPRLSLPPHCHYCMAPFSSSIFWSSSPPPPLCFLACLCAGLDTLVLLHGAQRRQARRMTLSSFAFINQQVKIKPAWVPALFYEICFCRRFIWKVKIQSTTLKVHLTKTSASDVTFPWLLLAEGQVSTWVYTEGNQKAGGISAVIALTWCKTESYLWNWRIRMWQDCW